MRWNDVVLEKVKRCGTQKMWRKIISQMGNHVVGTGEKRVGVVKTK